jgi:cell division protein FtsB
MLKSLRRFFSKGTGRKSSEEPSEKKSSFSGVAALLGFLAVMAVVIFGDRGVWDLVSLHQERGDLTREVERLRSDIHALQAEYKEYGASPAAVERAAREELNLVKPGETVYKFGDTRR